MTATGVKSWQRCAKIRCSALSWVLVESAAILGVPKTRQNRDRQQVIIRNRKKRPPTLLSRRGNILASLSAKTREFAHRPCRKESAGKHPATRHPGVFYNSAGSKKEPPG